MSSTMSTLQIGGVVFELYDGTARKDIATLKNSMSTAQKNISTLQSNVNTLTSTVTILEGATVTPDTTLTKAGHAADAKVTGERISGLSTSLNTNVSTLSTNLSNLSSTVTGITNGYVKSVGGQTGAVTLTGGTGITVNGTTITNSGIVSLGAGGGISVSGNKVTNTGVRSVATGTANGTISVKTGDASAVNVAVKGLGTGAYATIANYMPLANFEYDASTQILNIKTQ